MLFHTKDLSTQDPSSLNHRNTALPGRSKGLQSQGPSQLNSTYSTDHT